MPRLRPVTRQSGRGKKEERIARSLVTTSDYENFHFVRARERALTPIANEHANQRVHIEEISARDSKVQTSR